MKVICIFALVVLVAEAAVIPSNSTTNTLNSTSIREKRSLGLIMSAGENLLKVISLPAAVAGTAMKAAESTVGVAKSAASAATSGVSLSLSGLNTVASALKVAAGLAFVKPLIILGIGKYKLWQYLNRKEDQPAQDAYYVPTNQGQTYYQDSQGRTYKKLQ